MKRILIIFCLLPLLSHCSMTKPVKIPEIKKYTLTSVSKTKYPRHPGPDLYVSRMAANPGYHSNGMVYVKTPYELQSFSKSAWVATPSRLLHGLIIESLRNSRHFHSVIAPPNTGYARYQLDTKLIVFQQEFIHQPSQVRLVMLASIHNTKTQKTIAQRRFHIIKKAPQDNPYGGVVAANQAANELQKQLVRFIAQLKLAA